MKIKVNSEIGTLRKVLVHRPGKEVERLYPELFERLLFDDIMDLEVAQKEHDYFTNLLQKNHIEVYYIERIIAKVLQKNPQLKTQFVTEFVTEAITNTLIAKALIDFFLKIKDELTLVNALIAGVKKTEVTIAAKADLDALVTLHDSYPFLLDPIPNILFQRDPIAAIYDGINIHKMMRKTRRREAIFYRYAFKYDSEFATMKPLLGQDDAGVMEGGDVLVVSPTTLLVGLSERTTAQACQQLARKMSQRYPKFQRLIALEIPKSHATMHLDTMLTMVDHNLFAIDMEMAKLNYHSYVLQFEATTRKLQIEHLKTNIRDLLQRYITPHVKFVVVGGGEIVRAKREQWNDGANSLTIAPGKVVAYSRNKITIEQLEKAGVTVLKTPSSELSRGRGGPRCMTMPLERDDVVVRTVQDD